MSPRKPHWLRLDLSACAGRRIRPPTAGRARPPNGCAPCGAQSNPMATDPFMQQALDLAALAVGLSEPNPRVGCVIVAPDGRTVLGVGHTQRAGEAHAEIMALRH